MAELRMTPTRAALLRAADAGRIEEDWFTDQPGMIHLREYPRGTQVTKAVRAMKDAGWCETDPDDDLLHIRSIRVTDAGRAALAALDATTEPKEI